MEFKNIFNYIVNLGIDNTLSEKKIKRVRITNILAVSTILLVIPLYFLFENMGADFFKSLIPAVIMYQGLLLFLNKTGYINVSRFIAPNINSLIIFIYSTSLGHESLFFFFYFPAISGSFLYFELKERVFFIVQLLFTSVLIVFDLFVNVQPFPKIRQSPEDIVVLSYFLMLAAFVLFLICLFVLAAESQAAEKALIKAKFVAEDATHAKSNFLARMSHEIRTPINAVIGLTHLTLKTNLSDKQYDYLKKIYNASSSLLSIINEILDFSKIEAEKMKLENVPFKTKSVWNNVLDTIGLKAYNKGIELRFEIDDNIPEILIGDALRLGQILINLSDNAIKFTEHGYVTISAKRLNIKEKNRKVEILFSVKDTGIGLSDKQVENIFESFYQADESITRNFGGTGLGLSITKQLIELMGSKIKVESELKYGTEFAFTVLFDMVSDNSYGSDKSVGKSLEFKHAKLLLVEDNLINQQVLSEIVEHMGLDYDLASNGEEAFKMVLNNSYDLVLMDIQMPVMDGLTATKIIRDKGFRNLPIIAMTAHALEVEKEKSINAGMNEHLTKPVDPDNLKKVLSKYIAVKLTDTDEKVIIVNNENIDIKMPEINGIDVEIGLKRVGNSNKIYFKLLKEYLKSYKNSYEIINRYIEKRNIEEAKRYSHTLKGASSMLGMDEMSNIFSTIENYVANNELTDAISYLKTKEDLLSYTMESISDYFNENEIKTEMKMNKIIGRLEIKKIKKDIETLINKCKNNDSKAFENVDGLLNELTGTDYFKSISEISEKISDIEFKDAIILLEKLSNELEE